MNIGLLGGSFDPAHEGHMHISKIAKNTLNLDAIWWIITPQNPLKTSKTSDGFIKRYNKCKNITKNYPFIIISDIEKKLGSKNTYQTIKSLKLRFSKTNFFWLGGTDLIKDFHKWDNYELLMQEIPIVFIKRPPNSQIVKSSRLSNNSNISKIILQNSKSLKTLNDKNIIYILNQKTINQSSTNIRQSKIIKT